MTMTKVARKENKNKKNQRMQHKKVTMLMMMKMTSEKNGTTIPDLKAIINKFKKQNSGVHVRKANFRV